MIFFYFLSTWLSDLYITIVCVFCLYTTAQKRKLYFSITKPCRYELEATVFIKSCFYIVPSPSTTLILVICRIQLVVYPPVRNAITHQPLDWILQLTNFPTRFTASLCKQARLSINLDFRLDRLDQNQTSSFSHYHRNKLSFGMSYVIY